MRDCSAAECALTDRNRVPLWSRNQGLVCDQLGDDANTGGRRRRSHNEQSVGPGRCAAESSCHCDYGTLRHYGMHSAQ